MFVSINQTLASMLAVLGRLVPKFMVEDTNSAAVGLFHFKSADSARVRSGGARCEAKALRASGRVPSQATVTSLRKLQMKFHQGLARAPPQHHMLFPPDGYPSRPRDPTQFAMCPVTMMVLAAECLRAGRIQFMKRVVHASGVPSAASRRADTFHAQTHPKVTNGDDVKPAAGRRRKHAGRVCSPIPIASFRLRPRKIRRRGRGVEHRAPQRGHGSGDHLLPPERRVCPSYRLTLGTGAR
jgi:hypothetical protein